MGKTRNQGTRDLSTANRTYSMKESEFSAI